MEQTELSMVNVLLSAIEETPVQSVDLAHPDISAALQIWAEQSIAIQTVSWWFNTEKYQLLVDENTKEVFVPANCVSMDLPNVNFVQRGRRLYDKDKHSFDFSDTLPADLFVDCLIERSIEELPASVYRLILIASKIAMVSNRDQDKIKLEVLNKEYQLAYARVQQENLNYYGTNALDSTAFRTFSATQAVR